MTKWILILLIVFLTGTVSGCGKGSEYEGKWVGVANGIVLEKMAINKNGDTYTISSSEEGYQDAGKTPAEKGKTAIWNTALIPPVTLNAPLKDGKLMVTSTINLTYIPSQQTIVSSTGEVFEKETPAALVKLKQAVTDVMKKEHPKMTFEQS